MNEFWQWFLTNNKAFLFINQIEDLTERDRLLSGLLEKLHQYCDQLYFEIGGHPDEKIQELIITAEGQIDYFDQVEVLIANAPEIENWRFIAFKPPLGVEFGINYEGVKLDPKDMWFLPLENKEHPKLICIRVCIPKYRELKEHEWLDAAIYKVIDTVIGEKAFAVDISYIETDELPEAPEEDEDLLPIEELTDYIAWKKQLS